MQTLLRAKKKFGFIDGTVKQPNNNSPTLEDWWGDWSKGVGRGAAPKANAA